MFRRQRQRRVQHCHQQIRLYWHILFVCGFWEYWQLKQVSGDSILNHFPLLFAFPLSSQSKSMPKKLSPSGNEELSKATIAVRCKSVQVLDDLFQIQPKTFKMVTNQITL